MTDSGSITRPYWSTTEEDVDFWEFVHCAVCFSLWSDPPSTPFWATECGHVLCNNHLSVDGSCASCGTQSIQLIPLRKDLPEPMAQSFRPLMHGVDSILAAVRFQVKSLTNLLHFYQRRNSQQKTLLNKLGAELKSRRESEREVQALRDEIAMLRSGRQYGENVSDLSLGDFRVQSAMSSNGKRRRVDLENYNRMSSPRSVPTPLQPQRITLPSARHPPTLQTLDMNQDHRAHSSMANPNVHSSGGEANSRARLERFAYTTPRPDSAIGGTGMFPQASGQDHQNEVHSRRNFNQQTHRHPDQDSKTMPPPQPTFGLARQSNQFRPPAQASITEDISRQHIAATGSRQQSQNSLFRAAPAPTNLNAPSSITNRNAYGHQPVLAHASTRSGVFRPASTAMMPPSHGSNTQNPSRLGLNMNHGNSGSNGGQSRVLSGSQPISGAFRRPVDISRPETSQQQRQLQPQNFSSFAVPAQPPQTPSRGTPRPMGSVQRGQGQDERGNGSSQRGGFVSASRLQRG